MIATDESALICDLAETYHIFNYKELPCNMVALFSVGLRNDSRIKMKMNHREYPLETDLMALIVDNLVIMNWRQSGETGNRPQLIYNQLHRIENDNNDIITFNSSHDYEKKRKELLGEGGKHG